MELTNMPDRREMKLPAGALLIGIICDLLFYGKPVGISYLLFLFLLLVYFHQCLPGRIALKADFGTFLLASAILLATTFALFTNPVLRALNLAAVPVLTAMYAEQAAGLQWIGSWGLQRIIASLHRLALRAVGSMPVALRLPVRRLQHHAAASRFQTGVKIAIGLLVSLPLVILAVSLLSSADMLFQQTLQQIPDWFQGVPIGETLFRGLVIVIVGSYVFGFIWSLKQDVEKAANPEESQYPEQKRIRPIPALDPVITATVLVSVNAVYVLFTVVQFTYLFGGGQGLLPDGMTYAEYARRGFGEVVLVAVINFGLMLLTLYFTPVVRLRDKLIRPVLVLLLSNTTVLLVSAYVRLDLYEAAYGYTYTRFFVNAFLLWLGSMLVLMLAKIIRPGKDLFRTAFITTLAAYLLLNYVNIDAIIAERNIERYQTSGRIDWNYLNGLSYDAVPALMKLSKVEGGSPLLAEGFSHKKQQLQHETFWPSFNVSKFRAKRLIGE